LRSNAVMPVRTDPPELISATITVLWGSLSSGENAYPVFVSLRFLAAEHTLGVAVVVRGIFDPEKRGFRGLSGAAEDRRGVLSAAALVFCSGTAAARGVSGKTGGRGRNGCGRFTIRSHFGWGRRGGRRRGDAGESGEALFAEALGKLVLGHGHEGVEAGGGVGFGWGWLRGIGAGVERFHFGDLEEVHEAETFGRAGVGEGLAADAAFGLDFAEGVEAAVEDAVGLGAGAVDGFLLFFGFGVLHGVFLVRVFLGGVQDGDFGEVFFDHAAAAETPGGTYEFGGEEFFDSTLGGEFAPEGGADFGVVFGFVFADEVVEGEEAEGEGVSGGTRLTGLGAGSGGEGGVGFVGRELSV
jgi:hypothetical protein